MSDYDRFSDQGVVVTFNEDGTANILADGESVEAGLPEATTYPLPPTPGMRHLAAQRAKRAAKREADSGDVDYPDDEPTE